MTSSSTPVSPSGAGPAWPRKLAIKLRRFAIASAVLSGLSFLSGHGITAILGLVASVLAARSASAPHKASVKSLRFYACWSSCSGFLTILLLVGFLGAVIPVANCACDEDCTQEVYALLKENAAIALNATESGRFNVDDYVRNATGWVPSVSASPSVMPVNRAENAGAGGAVSGARRRRLTAGRRVAIARRVLVRVFGVNLPLGGGGGGGGGAPRGSVEGAPDGPAPYFSGPSADKAAHAAGGLLGRDGHGTRRWGSAEEKRAALSNVRRHGDSSHGGHHDDEANADDEAQTAGGWRARREAWRAAHGLDGSEGHRHHRHGRDNMTDAEVAAHAARHEWWRATVRPVIHALLEGAPLSNATEVVVAALQAGPPTSGDPESPSAPFNVSSCPLLPRVIAAVEGYAGAPVDPQALFGGLHGHHGHHGEGFRRGGEGEGADEKEGGLRPFFWQRFGKGAKRAAHRHRDEEEQQQARSGGAYMASTGSPSDSSDGDAPKRGGVVAALLSLVHRRRSHHHRSQQGEGRQGRRAQAMTMEASVEDDEAVQNGAVAGGDAGVDGGGFAFSQVWEMRPLQRPAGSEEEEEEDEEESPSSAAWTSWSSTGDSASADDSAVEAMNDEEEDEAAGAVAEALAEGILHAVGSLFDALAASPPQQQLGDAPGTAFTFGSGGEDVASSSSDGSSALTRHAELLWRHRKPVDGAVALSAPDSSDSSAWDAPHEPQAAVLLHRTRRHRNGDHAPQAESTGASRDGPAPGLFGRVWRGGDASIPAEAGDAVPDGPAPGLFGRIWKRWNSTAGTPPLTAPSPSSESDSESPVGRVVPLGEGLTINATQAEAAAASLLGAMRDVLRAWRVQWANGTAAPASSTDGGDSQVVAAASGEGGAEGAHHHFSLRQRKRRHRPRSPAAAAAEAMAADAEGEDEGARRRLAMPSLGLTSPSSSLTSSSAGAPATVVTTASQPSPVSSPAPVAPAAASVTAAQPSAPPVVSPVTAFGSMGAGAWTHSRHDDEEEEEGEGRRHGKRRRHSRHRRHRHGEKDKEDAEDFDWDGSPQQKLQGILRTAAGTSREDFEHAADGVCAWTPAVLVGGALLLGAFAAFHLLAAAGARKLARHPAYIAADADRKARMRAARAISRGGAGIGILPGPAPGPGSAGAGPGGVPQPGQLYSFVPGYGFVPAATAVVGQPQPRDPATPGGAVPVQLPTPSAAAAPAASAYDDSDDFRVMHTLRTAVTAPLGWVSGAFRARRGYAAVDGSAASSEEAASAVPHSPQQPHAAHGAAPGFSIHSPASSAATLVPAGSAAVYAGQPVPPGMAAYATYAYPTAAYAANGAGGAYPVMPHQQPPAAAQAPRL